MKNNRMEIENVAIYARVSTKEQIIDTQVEKCEQYCERMEWNVYETYKDVCTGWKSKRRAFNSMLTDMREMKFDAVICWKLDRMGRSLQHLIQIMQELENRKVGFICITQNIDTITASGRLLFHILGAFAEFERGLISERVKAGMDRSNKTFGRKFIKYDEYRARVLRHKGYSLKEISEKVKVSAPKLSRDLSKPPKGYVAGALKRRGYIK